MTLLRRRARPCRESRLRRPRRLFDLRDARMGVEADDIVGVGGIDVARRPFALHPLAGDIVLVDLAHVNSPWFRVPSPPRMIAHYLMRGLGAPAPQIKPRLARLRMRLPAPNVHGGQASQWRMRLTSRPSSPAETVTTSPGLWVKPLPGASRSAIGANIVPRNSTAPSGYWWLGPIIWPTRSAGWRLILAIDEPPFSVKPSSPSTVRPMSSRAQVVERESRVEQAQQRTDGAAGVLVLGLAQQQRGASLDIAQVDIVAQRRGDDASGRTDRQHDLGLRIVPARRLMEAGVRAVTDRRHRLALGEDLGVRPDADFQILRPRAFGDQRVLQPHGGGRARLEPRQVVADQPRHLGADRRRGVPIAARALLDHPLQHRGRERHAGGLDRLQIDRRQQPRPRGVAPVLRRVGENFRQRGDALARPTRAAPRRGRRVRRGRARSGTARVTSNSPCARTATTEGPSTSGRQTLPTRAPA